MIARIVTPVVAMAALGLTFGLGLAYALKIFGIKVDPTIALIISKLPGANCGACGKAGCTGFAEALKRGEALPSGCVVTNEDTRRAISEILGVEYIPKVKEQAVVLCNGGRAAIDKYTYRGIQNCKAASLVFGGYKACIYGCLGLGDCVKDCPFGAIKMNENGIPVVDPQRCTACGICVKACPKDLFALMPLESDYYIKCNSKDVGAVAIKYCEVACIACGKCAKVCPVSAITINENLAVIDYAKCTNCDKCFEVCPTKAIVKRG